MKIAILRPSEKKQEITNLVILNSNSAELACGSIQPAFFLLEGKSKLVLLPSISDGEQ